MGERTRSRIGTANGVKTVRVYSANPKTPDGYNTFIFRRDLGRSLNKLAWLPLVDISANQLPDGFSTTSDDVRYEREQKKAFVAHLKEQLKRQYGPVVNDDFGTFSLQRVFCQEVQRHALATRHEFMAVLSARQIAERMVHFAGAPNEEMSRKNGIEYFEYGLARVCLGCDHYLVMGVVGIRRGSAPYYDQHVVAKFKADSEASSLQGHMRFGESAFEQVYDNRFRLILQGVEMFYNTHSSTQTKQALERTPKFSIIIPCYKVEKYIRACLDSVLAQKCDSWEAICTDDGSPDGTGAILDEYAVRDSRIKVIHQQNAGLSAARNAAMARATGEWFIYLDSDDVLSPWALETYVDMIERHPDADLVKGGILYFNDGDQFEWGQVEANERVYDLSCEIKSEHFGGYFQQTAYRRSAFGDIPFVGLSWCEERPYVAKCMAKAKKLVWRDTQCYGFRRRMGSITHRQMTLDEWKGFLDATKEVLRIYYDSGKSVERWPVRGLVNTWMENQLALMISLLPKHFRVQAWEYWFLSLKDVCDIPGATSWQKFVARTCLIIPIRIVPLILCWLPHWLKTKGIHR